MKLKTNGWHEFAIVIFISAIEDVLIKDRYSVLIHPHDMFEFFVGIFKILIFGFIIYLCYKLGEDLCRMHLNEIRQRTISSRFLKNGGDTVWQIVKGVGKTEYNFTTATFTMVFYSVVIVILYKERSIFDTFFDYAREFSMEFVPRYGTYWIGIYLGRKTLNYKSSYENIYKENTQLL